MQAHRAVSDLPKEKHWTARLIGQCGFEFTLAHLRFERLAQGVFGTKESVGWHQASYALVRPKMVVVGKVVGQALARLGQVFWARSLPKLFSDRLPQALALPQGLWVVRACDDVANALAQEQLLKAAFSAPRKVLAPLVGQHFARLAKTSNALEQRLLDELAALLRGELPADYVAAKVIQKDR